MRYMLTFAILCCAVCARGESPAPNILTLEMAQRQALQENPSLKAAESRIAQARQRVVQARSLYFPQVEAAYSVSRTWLPESATEAARNAATLPAIKNVSQTAAAALSNPTQAGLANRVVTSGQTALQSLAARSAVDDTVDNYAMQFTARLILFDGMSREFGHIAAKHGVHEIEAARRDAQRLLLEATARSYFAIQLARESKGIADADETFNQRLLKEAQARQRAGAGSLSDVLNFEVQVRAAQASRLSAEREHDIARIVLASLMGIPSATLPDDLDVAPLDEESQEEMLLPEAAELVNTALRQRPDLAQNEYAVKRAKATLIQSHSVFLPQLSAIASAGANGDDAWMNDNDYTMTLGLTVSYSIFAGGRNWSQRVGAKHARREAELLRDSAEINVLSEVHETLAALKTAQEQLLLQHDTAGYVRDNRDLVEKEYKAGQGSLVRLTQAQRDLVQAQARLAVARVSLRQVWHQLRTATGETLQLAQ